MVSSGNCSICLPGRSSGIGTSILPLQTRNVKHVADTNFTQDNANAGPRHSGVSHVSLVGAPQEHDRSLAGEVLAIDSVLSPHLPHHSDTSSIQFEGVVSAVRSSRVAIRLTPCGYDGAVQTPEFAGILDCSANHQGAIHPARFGASMAVVRRMSISSGSRTMLEVAVGAPGEDSGNGVVVLVRLQMWSPRDKTSETSFTIIDASRINPLEGMGSPAGPLWMHMAGGGMQASTHLFEGAAGPRGFGQSLALLATVDGVPSPRWLTNGELFMHSPTVGFGSSLADRTVLAVGFGNNSRASSRRNPTKCPHGWLSAGFGENRRCFLASSRFVRRGDANAACAAMAPDGHGEAHVLCSRPQDDDERDAVEKALGGIGASSSAWVGVSYLTGGIQPSGQWRRQWLCGLQEDELLNSRGCATAEQHGGDFRLSSAGCDSALPAVCEVAPIRQTSHSPPAAVLLVIERK